MTKNGIIDIKKAGIIGSGGAGFPTYFKLNTKIDTLIINGAECEPLLETDKTILKEHLDDVLEGIKKAAELTGAKKVFICIKGKYRTLIDSVKNEIGSDIKVFPLKNIYPVGDEHILVREVTGKIIPEAGIPLNVGIIVQNVETMYHLGRMVRYNEKNITRFLTVTGDVKYPYITKVPIGTPVAYLLDIASPNIPLADAVIIDGGPMMGKFVEPTGFVKKTTSGIIILSKYEKVIRQRNRDINAIIKIARSACIQCRRCTDLCPRYLNGHGIEPHKWMRNLALSKLTPNEMAFLCSECGVCELFACPMDISPRLVAQIFKKTMTEKEIKNEHYHNNPEATRSYYDLREINSDRLMDHLDIKKFDHHPEYKEFGMNIDLVRIYTDQHIGKPSSIIVKKDDKVKKGDIIAISKEDELGVDYHSSIDGAVAEVGENFVEIIKRG